MQRTVHQSCQTFHICFNTHQPPTTTLQSPPTHFGSGPTLSFLQFCCPTLILTRKGSSLRLKSVLKFKFFGALKLYGALKLWFTPERIRSGSNPESSPATHHPRRKANKRRKGKTILGDGKHFWLWTMMLETWCCAEQGWKPLSSPSSWEDQVRATQPVGSTL